MQPTSTQILRCLRRTISERIGPALKSSAEASLLPSLDVALNELLARESRDHERIDRERNAWLEQGRELLGEELVFPQNPAARLEAMIVEAQRRLSSTGAERAALGAWMTDVVRWQYGLAIGEEDRAEAEPLEDPAIDQDRLSAAISRHLAKGEAVGIDRLSTLSGGYSRDTFLVEWSSQSGVGELVVRRQKARGMLDGAGVDLAGEFPLLRSAHQAGLPVPAVHWLETAAGSGGPYIAMEKIDGSAIGSAIDASSVDVDTIRAVARAVAKLHQADWQSSADDIPAIFGLSAEGLTIRSATQALLDRWEKVWAQRELDPSPALAAAFHWLRANVPDNDRRPCLLHGDIGFHNILFNGADIAALLDWEMAFLGDPAKDMATCEAFISRYGEWDEFVRCYHEAGGPAFEETAKRFYHVLRVFTHLLVGEMGWQTCFAHLESPGIEAMFLGGPIRTHFFADYLQYLPLISGQVEISQFKLN